MNNLKVFFANKRILWNVDNYAASIIVTKGSNKPDLQELAVGIQEICLSANITLIIKWIPRESNCTADLISKYVDVDNWEITDELFEYLDSVWGAYTIDRFVNGVNKKVGRFNSKFFEEGCAGTDAFQFDWRGEVNLFVPPVSTVCQVIKKVCQR